MFRTRRFVEMVVLAGCFAAAGTAFGQESGQQVDFGALMQGLGAMLGGSTNAAAQIVDFRELKALLPAELDGLKRTSAGGEKNSAMGMTVATAEGEYEGAEGASIRITLTDISALGPIAAMAQYGWASSEVDRETDTGYERTATIGGYKGMEKYDTRNQSGETSVMVAKRFVVEVKGSQVAADALRKALEKVDLKKLEGLQPPKAE